MSAAPAGAVAGGHTLTVQAAADTLADGGNAFDAAVAALWMACVTEPVLASPGGGGFFMALPAGGDAELYDFFVDTPRRKRGENDVDFHAVDADFGTATQAFHIGTGTSATPGFVTGLYAVHTDLGRLHMAQLIAPAARAARAGVAVTPMQAFLFEVVRPILTASAHARALFAPGRRLLREGDLYRNEELAGFLERLADGGLRFYAEEAVPALCAEQAERGHLCEEDFTAHEVVRRTPLAVPFREAQVYLNPPPSPAGAFIAHAMARLAPCSGGDPVAVADALAAAEAARLRHEGAAHAMLAEAGLAVPAAVSGGTASRGTTHVSVIDGEGNAASVTVSNGEGNGRIAGGFGFMLNNMLGEDDLCPEGCHGWIEGRRLASNMCPALATQRHGGLVALGSGGSNRIRSAVFQALAQLLCRRAPPHEAVAAPRLHVENGHLDFEDQFGRDARSALAERYPDHRAWNGQNLYFGGVHTARRGADGSFSAAGDRRRGGHFAVLG